ncbi:hypothetical protein GUJ93_ZPchr0006g42758 [Zizania palustris]|uniref:Uncharacterized protein n=1 Tax=Zizania palustris TaxID=103762 RepID=A0A8J5T787_ZIZPA|nr:hypothetical protein GUJ93_ZPchr0006g42758 [Zizania palustris]
MLLWVHVSHRGSQQLGTVRGWGPEGAAKFDPQDLAHVSSSLPPCLHGPCELVYICDSVPCHAAGESLSMVLHLRPQLYVSMDLRQHTFHIAPFALRAPATPSPPGSGWLPDGSFAAVKPESPDSYDGSSIGSFLASSYGGNDAGEGGGRGGGGLQGEALPRGEAAAVGQVRRRDP